MIKTTSLKQNESYKKKSELNKLRSDGFVPGILYGDIEKNISLSIKKATLDHFLKTTNFKSKVVKISLKAKNLTFCQEM